MALQTTYGRDFAGAAAGTPGAEFGHKASYLNDEGAAVGAGIFTAYKSEGKCENIDAATDKIAGVILNITTQDRDGLTAAEYAPDGAELVVLEEGPAYMQCEQSVTPADPVYVRHTVATTETLGAVRKDSDSGKARLVKGARFMTSGSSTTPPIVWFSKAADAAATVLTDSVASLAGTLTGSVDGTLADIAATAGSCAGGAEPSAAQVDTAIATAVASIVTGTNLQLKELQTTLNALLAVLR